MLNHTNEVDSLFTLIKFYRSLPRELQVNDEIQQAELEVGIALTKLGRHKEAEIYVKRTISALEREMNINKAIPVHLNICPSGHIKKFKLLMQSMALAYHHLGTIKRHLSHTRQATRALETAYHISQKYMKGSILKTIENDWKHAKATATAPRERQALKVKIVK